MTTITKDMSIAAVLEVSEDTIPILLEYGMHCFGCPMAKSESLEDACSAHGNDADELVEKLNAFLTGN